MEPMQNKDLGHVPRLSPKPGRSPKMARPRATVRAGASPRVATSPRQAKRPAAPTPEEVGVTPKDPRLAQLGAALVGHRLEVFWDGGVCGWYEGVICGYNALTRMHFVQFIDGDEEHMMLTKEKFFNFLDPKPALPSVLTATSDATAIPQPAVDEQGSENLCVKCLSAYEKQGQPLLMCESCPVVCHPACCEPPLTGVPDCDWICESCVLARRVLTLRREAIAATPVLQESLPPAVADGAAEPQRKRARKCFTHIKSPKSPKPLPPVDNAVLCALGNRLVSHRLEVYWPGEGQNFEGTITAYDAKSGKHRIAYEDGDEEEVLLKEEKVIWLDPKPVPPTFQLGIATSLEPEIGEEGNMETCAKCGQESTDDDPLLCCDGCPQAFHLRCAGVDSVPEGDWFCVRCSSAREFSEKQRAAHRVAEAAMERAQKVAATLAKRAPLPRVFNIVYLHRTFGGK